MPDDVIDTPGPPLVVWPEGPSVRFSDETQLAFFPVGAAISTRKGRTEPVSATEGEPAQ